MLELTRQINEGVVIGESIHVTVLNIRANQVRLAISSPDVEPSYWEETLYWEPAEAQRELQHN